MANLAMLDVMVCVACHHLDVLGPIVLSIVVDVVNFFARLEPPPELLLRYDAMLIGVAAHVSEMVILADAN